MTRDFKAAYFTLSDVFNPQMFVQLGVGKGIYFFSLYRPSIVECWAVDPYKNHRDTYMDFTDKAHGKENIYIFRGSYDRACHTFPDNGIDLLHLNLHKAAHCDFDLWKEKVSDRGIILIHNISNFQTSLLWNDIKKTYRTSLLNIGEGLGIVNMGNNRDPFIWGAEWTSITDFLDALDLPANYLSHF